MYHNIFVHSSVTGHLDCFHALAIVNNAAMNIRVDESFWIIVFSQYMPRSGFVGSYGNSIFTFLWIFHIVFYIGLINLQSP